MTSYRPRIPLAAALFLFCLPIGLWPRSSEGQHAAAGNQEKIADHYHGQGQQGLAQPVLLVGNKAAETKPADGTAGSAEERADWFSPAWLGVDLNALYVLVSILLFVGLRSQTRTLGEQLKVLRSQNDSIEGQMVATQSGAESARKTVAGYISSQRAWITVTVSSAPPDPRIPEPGIPLADVTLRNEGPTPGVVVDYYRDAKFPESLEGLLAPSFPEQELANPLLVVRERTFGGRDGLEPFWGTQELPAEILEGVKSRNRRVVFYGRVVYRDVFSEDLHETRFGYFYNPTTRGYSVLQNRQYNLFS